MSKTTFKFEITLRVVHPSIDPTEITQKLSMSPSYAHMVGQNRMTPKGNPLPGINRNSLWSFRVGGRSLGEQGTVPELIREMNEKLWPSRDYLSAIRDSGGSIDYSIGWFTDFNSGEVFDWALLKQCADLRIDLFFDVYGNEDRRGLD